MHLLPADRSDHRIIDAERICQAIEALDRPEVIAAATGINDATVSQTLRYLRASETVIAERDGRVVRYRLASTPVPELLGVPQVPTP